MVKILLVTMPSILVFVATHILQHLSTNLLPQVKYSKTLEIETADLSQSHASLNLSQFRAYCLFHRDSSTVAKKN